MTDVSGPVVTRFAPSPTGFLHIGGARTALYNWLLARRHNGKFLLRIEDTDRERSTDAAVDAILDGIRWLGLDWDGEAVSQFSRADRHKEIADSLIASGNAYRCFATPEENTAAREAAREAGKQFLGDLWRDRSETEAPEGRDPVIRFKMPRQGETTIIDEVQGQVTVPNHVLDDLVILRADGTPTYMLSVVVDDHDMGITHIVRGDDHLNNTFKQVKIYGAMGWDLPSFAHIPLIHGADGKKLSKRHGALGVDAYRDMGFLADAVNNYLLRLGWSHGDTEIMTKEEAQEVFTLSAVNKGAARFDFDKLDHLNAHYLRHLSPDALYDAIHDDIRTYMKRDISELEKSRIIVALPSVVERAKRLGDLIASVSLCCNTGPLDIDDKVKAKLPDTAADLISATASALEDLTEFSAESAKAAMIDLAATKEVKLGAVMQPVRAAITGGIAYGDLIQLISLIGADECLKRLRGARL